MRYRHTERRDYERVKQLLLNENMTEEDFFEKESFKGFIARNRKYCFVAENKGVVVGHVSGFDDGGHFYGYIGRLVVDSNFRKKGIATKLMGLCIKEFRKTFSRKKEMIIIISIHKRNVASLTLAKMLGALDEEYKTLFFIKK